MAAALMSARPPHRMARIAVPGILLLAALLLLRAPPAWSGDSGATLNQYGLHGLIQTPNARIGEDGSLRFGIGRSSPYTTGHVSATFLPWAEGAVRYTDVGNRRYGRPEFSGEQSYKDRAVDLKILIREESRLFPAVAIGLRDLAGTRIFASEYIVFSKRLDNLDISVGLGWGRMSGRRLFGNPLGLLSSSLKRRTSDDIAGAGGGSKLNYFRGRDVGLFGGIEWQTPVPSLRVKLEYDPQDYGSSESAFDGLPQRSKTPFNAGLVWRPRRHVEVTAGVVRGNTLMGQLVLRANMHRDRTPSLAPPPEPFLPRPRHRRLAPVTAIDQKALAGRVFAALGEIGITGDSLSVTGRRLRLDFHQSSHARNMVAMGRVARLLEGLAPPFIEEFALTPMVRGGGRTTMVFMRRDLYDLFAGGIGVSEVRRNTLVLDAADPTPASGTGLSAGAGTPPRPGATGPATGSVAGTVTGSGGFPDFSWGVEPDLRQQIGGPDGFFLYQLAANAWFRSRITGGLHLDGALGIGLVDNFDRLKQESDSTLPHVRSDITRYLRASRAYIDRLEASHVSRIGRNVWLRGSAGYLESMFAGFSAELLWRPPEGKTAIGIELSHVWQRSYGRRLGLRRYNVTTGHVSLYRKLPFHDMTVAIHAGRYLARDVGATLELRRRFRNGTEAGVFVTRTNVSARQFGEGRFDKGFFIRVPLGVIRGTPSATDVNLLYRPLTRDGGQRLTLRNRLYDLTGKADRDTLLEDFPSLAE